MEAHFEYDTQMIAEMSPEDLTKFAQWMSDLEAVMDRHKQRYGERPYGHEPLAKATGLACWKDSFDVGMTPEEAFEADRECWDED